VKPGPDLSRYARLGIRSEADLLLHLPLRYEDETRLTAIADLRAGSLAQVEGEVVRNEVTYKGRRSLLVELRDDSGTVSLKFFNFYGSQQKQLALGNRIRASGEARGGLFGMEFVHPKCRVVRADTALPTSLTPVYPTAQGIGQGTLRGVILEALDRAQIIDTVPPSSLPKSAFDDATLPSIQEALQILHRPGPTVSIEALLERSHPAWRRVIFDELLAQQLSLKRARATRSQQSAIQLSDDRQCRQLMTHLPFELTSAQRRCWAEIGNDLARRQRQNHCCRLGCCPGDQQRRPGGADGADRDFGRTAS
jgi:ATP-dependent DNA helicase RecG